MVYIFVLAVMSVLDGVWLKLTSDAFYRPQLAHVFAPTFTFWPALLFYPLYALAVYVFVVAPALQGNATLGHIALRAALLGAATYGAYDFTNQATIRNWPVVVTFVDIGWGMFVTTLVSLLVVVAVRAVNSH